MTFDQIKRRLYALDTACLCDADKELRVVDSAIRPVRSGLKLVGRAHTVSCREDFLTVIKGLRDAEPDDVLVIDSQGSRRALCGELFLTEALRKRLAGIVIDGPCRDTAAIGRRDLPYYARFAHPVAGAASKIFETQIPITCGGVIVNPGDIVFGDDDGLVVAAVAEISEIIEAAEEIQNKEGRLLAEMRKGVSLLDLLNFEDHCANVRAGRQSKLQFLI